MFSFTLSLILSLTFNSIFEVKKLSGLGRNAGNKAGSGPAGSCVCPNCGHKVKHTRGSPCYNRKCPKCGTDMTRE
jgi:Zn finger protein HypA/HybF involved in hydrogenase expression